MTEEKKEVAAAEGRSLADIRRAPLVAENAIAVFDTAAFEHMQRVAKAISLLSYLPKALIGRTPEQTVANCLKVVNQANRWRMDPYALMEHAYEVHGRIGYEGKVIAAVVNGHRDLESRLAYEYSGSGDGRKVAVSGKLKGETAPRTIEGTVGGWKTENEKWKSMADQMLAYRGAREWARRHMPDALLGVYSDDELEAMIDLQQGANGVYEPAPPRPQRSDFTDAGAGAAGSREAIAGGPPPPPPPAPAAPAAVAPLFLLATEYGEELPQAMTAHEFAVALGGRLKDIANGGTRDHLEALWHNNGEALLVLQDAHGDLARGLLARYEEAKALIADSEMRDALGKKPAAATKAKPALRAAGQPNLV